MAIGACYGAWAIRRIAFDGDFPDFGTRSGWIAAVREPLLLIELPILICCMWAFGLYRPRRDRTVLAESLQLLKAGFVSVVGLIVILWGLGPRVVGQWLSPAAMQAGEMAFDAPRVQLAAMMLLVPAMLLAHRITFRLSLRAIRRRGWNLRHVLVIGTGRLGRIACRTLDRNSWTGLHVAAFLHHGEHASTNILCVNRPVLGGLADLNAVMEQMKPDAVYLALPAARATAMPQLLRRLERFAVDVRIIPDVHPRYMPQSMTVSDLEGMPILSVRESPMTGLDGMVKRTLDIIGASLAMLVFAPLMIAVGVAVRLSSRGPVIFKQARVSLGGEVFNIYKFRTMFHAEEERREASEVPGASPAWTQRDDPRITRVGKFLRRTSLDELPQLFNVLLGDMSLVGPRPERPELIDRFRDDWRGYMLRQHVKAGITGWAQVNGLRGDTSLRKRLQHDLFYIRHWSLGFDIKILWLTLFRGFVHRNAH